MTRLNYLLLGAILSFALYTVALAEDVTITVKGIVGAF